MVTIYSIIASLKNELGHFYEYNLALSKAARINNFEHIKIIPKTAKLPAIDCTWKKIINEIDHKNKWKNLKNIFPLIKIFKKINKDEKSIIFLEDFNLIILILILIASFFVRPKAELWLFHRFEYDKTFLQGKAYKFIQLVFEKIYSKKRVKYLTDSELIKNINGYFFNRTFHVFPIPHIYFSEGKKQSDKRVKKFWWPGGLIREEKGLNNIKKILSLSDGLHDIEIIIADSAKELVPNNNVIFVPTNLCRKEYEKLMVSSDLILLPYISELYRFRTSGIFVEAIMAGSIPVVSKNTWMAYELKKFDLQNLILDWESSNIIKKLNDICLDENIYKNIVKMQQCYKKFHSLENYASIMKEVLNF